MISWTLEKRLLTELKKFSKNPRRISKHDAEHLKDSIEKFGVCQPIVINTDNTIIAGHQRFEVLKSLGVQETSVLVPSNTLTEKEVEELCIRTNKNLGEFDYDLLANCFDAYDLVEWGFQEKDFGISEEASLPSESDLEEEPEKCPTCGKKMSKKKSKLSS